PRDARDAGTGGARGGVVEVPERPGRGDHRGVLDPPGGDDDGLRRSLIATRAWGRAGRTRSAGRAAPPRRPARRTQPPSGLRVEVLAVRVERVQDEPVD